MAQAAYAPEPAPDAGADDRPAGPSFDVLRWHDEPWTAQLALDLLPETNGPKVEVLSGSVIVTPTPDMTTRMPSLTSRTC